MRLPTSAIHSPMGCHISLGAIYLNHDRDFAVAKKELWPAVDDHSVLLAWMRLDPRVDPLRGRQCFADVEKRVYGLNL